MCNIIDFPIRLLFSANYYELHWPLEFVFKEHLNASGGRRRVRGQLSCCLVDDLFKFLFPYRGGSLKPTLVIAVRTAHVWKKGAFTKKILIFANGLSFRHALDQCIWPRLWWISGEWITYCWLPKRQCVASRIELSTCSVANNLSRLEMIHLIDW